MMTEALTAFLIVQVARHIYMERTVMHLVQQLHKPLIFIKQIVWANVPQKPLIIIMGSAYHRVLALILIMMAVELAILSALQLPLIFISIVAISIVRVQQCIRTIMNAIKLVQMKHHTVFIMLVEKLALLVQEVLARRSQRVKVIRGQVLQLI